MIVEREGIVRHLRGLREQPALEGSIFYFFIEANLCWVRSKDIYHVAKHFTPCRFLSSVTGSARNPGVSAGPVSDDNPDRVGIWLGRDAHQVPSATNMSPCNSVSARPSTRQMLVFSLTTCSLARTQKHRLAIHFADALHNGRVFLYEHFVCPNEASTIDILATQLKNLEFVHQVTQNQNSPFAAKRFEVSGKRFGKDDVVISLLEAAYFSALVW
jgi:hypothetical protein